MAKIKFKRKRQRERNARLFDEAQAAADAVAEREQNAQREAVERAAKAMGWPGVAGFWACGPRPQVFVRPLQVFVPVPVALDSAARAASAGMDS